MPVVSPRQVSRYACAFIPFLTHSLILQIQTVIWLVIAIALLFTCFRFVIRLYALRKLLADDVAVAAALVLLLSLAIMYHYAIPPMFAVVQVAEGEKAFTASFQDQAAVYLRLQFAIIVLFWTTIWVVKTSFLIFYRTVFAGLPEHMLGWRLVAGFTALTYLLCWAFQLASCVPVPDYFILGESGHHFLMRSANHPRGLRDTKRYPLLQCVSVCRSDGRHRQRSHEYVCRSLEEVTLTTRQSWLLA